MMTNRQFYIIKEMLICVIIEKNCIFGVFSLFVLFLYRQIPDNTNLI